MADLVTRQGLSRLLTITDHKRDFSGDRLDAKLLDFTGGETQVGWIALGPLVPAAIGGVLQRTTGTDSVWHSGWHIGGAGAVAWVLYLI